MLITINNRDNSIDWGVKGEDRIIQNVRNILRTRCFEVPFMRHFGIDPDFIDATPQHIKSDFITHVREVIEANEERVSVKEVRLLSCDENGNYTISVDLEV